MSVPIFIKVLKAEDVQNTNGAPNACGRFVNGLVDLVDDPDEHASIDALDKSVADVQSSHGVQGGRHTLSLCEQRACCQSIDQVLCSHLKWEAVYLFLMSVTSTVFKMVSVGETQALS